MNARRFLMAGALLSGGIAVLHMAIFLSGPAAYTYFGAPDLGASEARGSSVPDVVTAVLVILFGLASLYGIAGANGMRLPLLRLGLIAIGSVFTLRGLGLVPELLATVRGTPIVPGRYLLFSIVSLVTGLCYLLGTLPQWRSLRQGTA